MPLIVLPNYEKIMCYGYCASKSREIKYFFVWINFHLRVYIIEFSEFFSMLGADITKKLLEKE